MEYKIGDKVRVSKNVNAFLMTTEIEMEGIITSIDTNLVRIECRTSKTKTNSYNVRPGQIVEVLRCQISEVLTK